MFSAESLLLCQPCVLRLLLLLSAGDIECNSGPMQCSHPCGVCFKPVTSRQHAVLCEVCCYWLHTKCIGVSKEEYSVLQQSDEPWSCKNCQKEAMPFFNISNSDSIFDTFKCTTSSDSDSSLSPHRIHLYSVCKLQKPPSQARPSQSTCLSQHPLHHIPSVKPGQMIQYLMTSSTSMATL